MGDAVGIPVKIKNMINRDGSDKQRDKSVYLETLSIELVRDGLNPLPIVFPVKLFQQSRQLEAIFVFEIRNLLVSQRRAKEFRTILLSCITGLLSLLKV